MIIINLIPNFSQKQIVEFHKCAFLETLLQVESADKKQKSPPLIQI